MDHYRNLRERVVSTAATGWPGCWTPLPSMSAPPRLLRRVVEQFLAIDPPGTLEQVPHVLHGFAMPAGPLVSREPAAAGGHSRA